MGQAIGVRGDFKAGEVRRLAKRARDVGQARRLLAIAAVLDVPRGQRRPRLAGWTARRFETG